LYSASARAYCYTHAFANARADGHTSPNAYSHPRTTANDRHAFFNASGDRNANA
jgi:hypothetical protein